MNNGVRILLIAFCCMILPMAVRGQQPSYIHLEDNNGLPGMIVYDLMQDSRGFMWFATENGFCRYDGSGFESFTHPSIRGASFDELREGRDGKIYAKNFSRQIFTVRNDVIHPLKGWDDKKILYGNTTYEIDSNNQVWVATSIGLISVNEEKGQVNHYLPGNKIWDVRLIGRELYITADTLGLCKVQQGKVIPVPQPVIPRGMVFSQTYKRNFIYSSNLACVYEMKGGKMLPVYGLNKLIGNETVIRFFEDKKGNFWILTYNGAFCIDSTLTHLVYGRSFFSGETVTCFAEDREGNYWFGTRFNGVFMIPGLHVFNAGDEGVLKDLAHAATMVKMGPGTLAVGLTKGRIAIMNTRSEVVDVIETHTNNETESMLWKPEQQKLYFTMGTGIYSYDARTRSTKKIHTEAGGHLAALGSNYLLLSAGYGLSVLPDGTSTDRSIFQRYKKFGSVNSHIPDGFRFEENDRCRCSFYEATEGEVWAGFDKGLKVYGEGQTTLLTPSGKPIIAKAIAKDGSGNIWVGSYAQGIFVFRDKKIIRQLNTANGLVSDIIKSLLLINGEMWVGTNKGIHSIHTGTFRIKTINQQDGLSNMETNAMAGTEEYLWVTSHRGIQRLDLNAAYSNQTSPLVYISRVLILDKDTVAGDSPLQLEYNNNNITFKVNGLAYRSLGNFQFKYRLSGMDTLWRYTSAGKNSEARFFSLPAGNYFFEVKAVNEDGVESLVPASFRFSIGRPYWQKWWFSFGIIFAVVVIVSSIFLIRIQILKSTNRLALEKSQVETDLRQSQLASLKVQMNPHFMFNALNSIQEFIMTNEKKLANSYLGKFSDLMRLTLDMSQEESILLADEIKMLQLYLELESLRFSEEFRFQLQVDEQLDPDSLKIPSMLVQPYIENAFKHGLLHKKSNKQLSIRFSPGQEAGSLHCEVEDNGIGRKKSAELKKFRPQKHKSFAINATQKRLELLNYGKNSSISVHIVDKQSASGAAQGTLVILEIPYITA